MVPTTNFDGTGPLVGPGRSQPLQGQRGSRRDGGEDLRSVQQSDSNRTLEEFFLSTGIFQRGESDGIRRPLIEPKRFKKQSNRREESQDTESDGSLEEIFLSTGVFQRNENDGLRSVSKADLRRLRRQTGGNQNCVAVLKNDCQDAVVQQCQIGKSFNWK